MGEIVQRLRITVNGRAYDVLVEDLGAEAPTAAVSAAASAAAPFADPVPASAASPPPSAAAGEVRAPMPGVVSEIRVRVGQAVEAGDALLILEAMKMDNEIPAPAGGTVREVRVGRGDQVAAQQVLVILG